MLDWRLYPFVKLLLPFACGIGCAYPFGFLNILFVYIGWGAALCFGVLAWVCPPSKVGYPLSIGLFLAGFSWFEAQYPQHSVTDVSHKISHKTQPWIGIVEEKTSAHRFYRCVIALEGCIDSALTLATGHVMVYLPQTPKTAALNVNDRLLLHTTWQPTRALPNPHATDYSQSLAAQGIFFQAFIPEKAVEKIGYLPHTTLKQWGHQTQAWLAKQLQSHLPTAESFAVGTALVLGYKEATTPEVRQAYVNTGAMHILAISGMHILLLFNILDYIFTLYPHKNKYSRWLQMGLSLLIIWLFALVTGLGGSVLRAVVMASIIGVGKLSNARANVYNMLAASAFALLAINPWYLFDIGFQLSYLAVWGIVFWQPKLMAIWPVRRHPWSYAILWRRRKKVSKIHFWHLFLQKTGLDIKYYIWEALAIGIAAQAMITPISLYYFHQFPSYFWLSGLLAIPVSTMALVAGLLVCIGGPILWIGSWMGSIFLILVELMNGIIFKLQYWPYATIENIFLSNITLWGIYLIILGCAYAIVSKRITAWIPPLSILLFLVIEKGIDRFQHEQRACLTVYAVPKQSVIEYDWRGNVYALYMGKNDSSSLKKRENAVKGHHKKRKIHHIQEIAITSTANWQYGRFYKGLWQMANSSYCLVLTQSPYLPLDIPIETVILSQAPPISIRELSQKIKFKYLVFDLSNPPPIVKSWVSECQSMGISYHNIYEKGAWQVFF